MKMNQKVIDTIKTVCSSSLSKPTMGLTPRHFWLRNRVSECIRALDRIEEIEDWDEYKTCALELSSELLYCVTEWEKFYPTKKK